MAFLIREFFNDDVPVNFLTGSFAQLLLERPDHVIHARKILVPYLAQKNTSMTKSPSSIS